VTELNRRDFLTASAAVATVPLIGAGAAEPAWAKLPTEAYPGKRDDISFVDPARGWYGTGKGDLFRTTDGGASWAKVASKPGTFIRALGFVDANTGFIGNVGTDYYPGVTDTTPLYRTDDGGVTWTPADLGGKTIVGVCAIDVLKVQRIYQGKLEPRTIVHAAGRVGGPAGLLRSTDGGKSWSVSDLSAQAGMILDIKFFDEQTGLIFAASGRDAASAEGLILRTEDAGKNWAPVYRSGRKPELIWKASFANARVGYATVQSYDAARAQQLIVKTVDGGKSWTELPMVMEAKARQFGIGFVDEERGWVGTAVGGYETRDGGKTFSAAPIARAANKFRVVADGRKQHIFAIGTEVQRLTID